MLITNIVEIITNQLTLQVQSSSNLLNNKYPVNINHNQTFVTTESSKIILQNLTIINYNQSATISIPKLIKILNL